MYFIFSVSPEMNESVIKQLKYNPKIDVNRPKVNGPYIISIVFHKKIRLLLYIFEDHICILHKLHYCFEIRRSYTLPISLEYDF